MKIKLIVVFSLIVLLAAVFLFVFFDTNQKNIFKTISSEKESKFLINKNFISVRKSITQGKFEEEISQVNQATPIEKKWVDKKILLQKPLSKDRFWEFDGTLLAKIKVKDYENPVDMKHKVSIGSGSVSINTSLESPIEEVGLTQLDQEINFVPNNTQTLCSIKVTMTAKRIIPFFMEKYAKDKIEKESQAYLDRMTEAINNLPEPKPGIVIPIE
jgi:hypothetical protein